MTKIRGWRYFSLVMAVMLALGVGAIVVTPSHATVQAQCVPTSTGTGTACFTADTGTLIELTALSQSAINCAPKRTLRFTHGYFGFKIVQLRAPGFTAMVTITLPANMPVGTEYWKCIDGQWVDCTSLLSDDDGDNVLVLKCTDGDFADADHLANSAYFDPGGPAVAVAGPSTAGPGVSWRPRPLNASLISLQYLSINPQETSAGQPVTITTNVVNTGDEAGNLNVALKINGQVEETRTVSVGPQGTQPVKFTVTKAQPGTYDINILDKSGSFIITGSSGTTASTSGGLIALMFVVVVALIIVTVVLLLRRRTA